jgi:hypothetical protein
VKLSSEILKLILKYCEINDYTPAIVKKPVVSNDLEVYVGLKNNRFIKNIKHENYIELFEAANYLIMQSLIVILYNLLHRIYALAS